MALFGRSGPEEVRSDALYPLLNSLFEKKLGSFAGRAERAIRELQEAGVSFSEACNELERLDAEPYVENIYFKTIAAIKSQKQPYVHALRQVIGRGAFQPGEGPNSYERYRELLSNVEGMTNEVMKANANFKMVLYCYGAYLGPIKQSFSSIERSRDALRKELNARMGEASEFSSLNGWLSRLAAQREEQETIARSIHMLRESLAQGDRGALERDEAALTKKLAEASAGLTTADGEIGRLSSGISLLTTPLERPARKMDHLTLGKRQLHPLIADPVERIRTETEYLEFRELVKEMKQGIEKGSIDAKNKDGALDAVSTLLNADLFGMVQSLRELRQRRSGTEYEVKTMERSLNDVKEGRSSSERTAHDIVSMEGKLAETGRSIESAKQMIEKLFLEYYGKRISVII